MDFIQIKDKSDSAMCLTQHLKYFGICYVVSIKCLEIKHFSESVRRKHSTKLFCELKTIPLTKHDVENQFITGVAFVQEKRQSQIKNRLKNPGRKEKKIKTDKRLFIWFNK